VLTGVAEGFFATAGLIRVPMLTPPTSVCEQGQPKTRPEAVVRVSDKQRKDTLLQTDASSTDATGYTRMTSF
jgi:hypothetical protein